jgi:hypothetical protein
LPIGCRGIEKLLLLRDKGLVAFLSEGYFYVVDMNHKDTRMKMKLNIRIPHEAIKNFDVDYNMTTVLLATTNGNVFLYDLPKAFENESAISKKKVQMGMDHELVYTYLD